jgi:hypothetical protein
LWIWLTNSDHVIRVTLEGVSAPTIEQWASRGWTVYYSVCGPATAPGRWRFDVQTESGGVVDDSPFPLDMLRYDGCWPFRAEDTAAIEQSLAPSPDAQSALTRHKRQPVGSAGVGGFWKFSSPRRDETARE